MSASVHVDHTRLYPVSWDFTDIMAFNRGTKDDYDRWARVTGDDGWSWDKLYPKFVKRLDTMTPPVDHHNITGEYDPAVHDHGQSFSLTSLLCSQYLLTLIPTSH